MNPIELPNPLSAGRIVKIGASYGEYSTQFVKRGDPAYVVSRGDLTSFWHHARKWFDYSDRKESSGEMQWGSLVDCLSTDRESFERLYAVEPETYPDTKTGEAKPWSNNANFCRAWKQNQGSKRIIDAATLEAAELAVVTLKIHSAGQEILANSDKQVWIEAQYKDGLTGIAVTVRVLVDLLPRVGTVFEKSVIDLKTVSSGHPVDHCRLVHNLKLHWQAALYLDAVQATGRDVCDFRHLTQESSPPYITDLWCFTEAWIQIGRQGYLEALKAYCRCLKQGWWPGYEGTFQLEDGGKMLPEPSPWML